MIHHCGTQYKGGLREMTGARWFRSRYKPIIRLLAFGTRLSAEAVGLLKRNFCSNR